MTHPPVRPLEGAPALGEHSREILGEAGLAPAELDALAAQGII